MNRRMASGMSTLALAIGMLLVMTGPAHLVAAQTMGPEDVVRALNAANNARDAAAMRALIAPSAHFIQDPGEPGSTDQSREEFIAGATAENSSSSSISNLAQIAPDTVTFDITLTGPGLPKLAHPLLLHATVTVAGGVITHAVFVTSTQSRQDIAALGPPPGMPTTGDPDNHLWELLGVGLLLCAAGVLAQRALRATL